MGMDYTALLRENQSFRSDYPAEIKYAFSCKEYELSLIHISEPTRPY